MLIVSHCFSVSANKQTNKQINGACSVMTLSSQSFCWFCSSWEDRDDPEHAADPTMETPPDMEEAAVSVTAGSGTGCWGWLSVLGEGSCWVLFCALC